MVSTLSQSDLSLPGGNRKGGGICTWLRGHGGTSPIQSPATSEALGPDSTRLSVKMTEDTDG